jgi:hypothetical protein
MRLMPAPWGSRCDASALDLCHAGNTVMPRTRLTLTLLGGFRATLEAGRVVGLSAR